MYYERTVLANGLRLLIAPIPGVHSATTAVFIGAGSRYERENQAGVAHLIEHLLFKGTERRPSPRAVSETIERVGGILNAATDKEATTYWAKTASLHVELGIDLLSDMLLHSRMRPRDIAKEKAVIVEELNMTLDAPHEWVHMLIDDALWPGHPLGRDVGGTAASVTALTRADIRHFFSEYYSASNAVVAVAGGIDPDRVYHAVERRFGGWAPAPAPRADVAPAVDLALRTRTERKATEQAHICLGYPAIGRNDPDHYALDLLATALGGSMSSRLFIELRERMALAYDVHAYTNKFADTGSFVVYASVDPAQGPAAIRAILEVIERVRRRSIPEQELAKVKEYTKGHVYLSLEDTQAVVGWLGAQELLLGRIDSPEAVVAAIDAVRPADMRRLARELLHRGRARLALIGPDDTRLLAAFAA